MDDVDQKTDKCKERLLDQRVISDIHMRDLEYSQLIKIFRIGVL